MPGGNDNCEAQIRDLMFECARLVDHQQFRDWLDLFTEDGSYSAITYENNQENGLYLFKDDGKESLKERATFLMGFWQVGRGKTLHTLSNISITPLEEDEATANSYFVIYRTGDDGVTRFHACGEYEDNLVRQEGRWLFRKRKAIVDNGVLPSHFTDLI